MRGKVDIHTVNPTPDGITPACAGKSHFSPRCSSSRQDHPRVCGEKFDSVTTMRSFLGSPPRMRGKERFPPQHSCIYGITPACAGKRLSLFGKTYPEQDHPRVCGEKAVPSLSGEGISGSPPRVRGKVVHRPWRRLRLGITPAYTGKRPPAARWNSLAGDHPRVCGEKLSTTSTDIHPAGSPPRVRGKVNNGVL